MAKHLERLSREVIESLEIFKTKLDKVLNNLLQVTLLGAGQFDSMMSRGPFQAQLFCDPNVQLTTSFHCQAQVLSARVFVPSWERQREMEVLIPFPPGKQQGQQQNSKDKRQI